MSSSASDTIDLVEVGRVLRRGWRTIAASVAIGLALAIGVLWLSPRRFDGSTSLLVRASQGAGGSILGRLAGGDGAIGGLLGGGALPSQLDTEVEILSSRALASAVVDSLHLQAEVREPEGRPAWTMVNALHLPGAFRPVTVTLNRSDASGAWRVSVDDETTEVPAGQPIRLPVGVVTLSAEAAKLDHLELELFDREDAVTEFGKRLAVGKSRGEVMHVGFRAPDSLTAAMVPNALAAEYLALRRTSDRGNTEHRVEFLTAQLDSVQTQLTDAERGLQAFQESSGMIDGPTIGKLQLERAAELRTEIGTLDVERGALDQLVNQVNSGGMTARQLAAYPTFLRSSAINELLSQISTLETERSKLLERRLETDQEVVALDRSIASLEGQLAPLAAAYRSSITRQRNDIAEQLDTLRTRLGALPAALASGGRLQRDVLRLSQIHAALQAQLVEARLAAVSEGGNARVLDTARPAKRAAFPPRALTLAGGVGGGLFVGMLVVLLGGMMGRYVEDPRAIERLAGVPTLRLESAGPLMVGNGNGVHTLLLLPTDSLASTAGVAERLARTAMARSITATILDLSAVGATPGGERIGERIARMEAENGLVIVRLPGLDSDATAAALSSSRPVLLVAPPDRVDRHQLLDTIESLRRLEVPCAGVVMNRSSDAPLLRA